MKQITLHSKVVLIIALTVLAQFPLSLVRFSVPVYGENLGFPYFYFGLMGSAYGAAYTIFAPVFGKVAGKVGPVKVAFFGLLTNSLVILVFMVVVSPYFFVLLFMFQGLAQSMIWPQIEAITNKHGKTVESSILTYTLSWSTIAAVGPFIASFMLENSYYIPFWVSSILSLAAISVLFMLPKDGPPVKTSEVKNVLQLGSIWSVILPMLSYGFVVAVICSFYPAYGVEISLGVVNTGLVYLTFGLASVASFILARMLYLRWGVRQIVLTGLLLSLLIILLVLSKDLIIQIAVMTLVGFGTGFIYFGCLSSVFLEGSRDISLKTGIFEASIGAGVFVGPLISGIPTSFSFNFPWIVIFSGLLMILVTYAYTMRNPSKANIPYQ